MSEEKCWNDDDDFLEIIKKIAKKHTAEDPKIYVDGEYYVDDDGFVRKDEE